MIEKTSSSKISETKYSEFDFEMARSIPERLDAAVGVAGDREKDKRREGV